MNDSLKYGFPLGIFSFMVLYLNVNQFSEVGLYIRLILEVTIGIGVVLLSIKSANSAYFPFSFAFFSGFNVLFISIASKALLMLIFKDEVLYDSPESLNDSKLLWYSIFRESLSHFVIGVFVVSALAWGLKKKQKKI